MTPQDFITRWEGKDVSERANYPLFISELCDLLQVEKPQPALADDWHNTYVNERYIDARDGASAGNARFIDTYRRGCFICEAKSFNLGKNTETAERKLVKAKSQAEICPVCWRRWKRWRVRTSTLMANTAPSETDNLHLPLAGWCGYRGK
ncbi:MAG: hypothetical protein Q8J70_11505 [Thiobacillus sp.]|nr:hypothetical protein [Thiobacillus sp.]